MAKDKLISYGLWLHEYFLTKQKEKKKVKEVRRGRERRKEGRGKEE